MLNKPEVNDEDIIQRQKPRILLRLCYSVVVAFILLVLSILIIGAELMIKFLG